MNKIETLIKELCPNGVEWCELWEETVWDKKFNSVENYKQAEVDKYRYLLASDATKIIQEVGEIKILTTNKSDIYTTNEFVEEFYDEEIIAIPWGGNPIVQYYKGKFVTADNRIARVKDKNRLNTKFLYYYLTNNLTLISTFYRGSGIKHPNMLKVLSIKIPVPPLEIQEEIVKILDKFTDYVTELTTELTLRQKQYNYYRDKLFTFESEKVEWKRLEEVCEIFLGVTYTPSYTKDGVKFISAQNISKDYLDLNNIKYISYEEYQNITRKAKPQRGDVLFARVGSNTGHPVVLESDEEFCIFVSIGYLRPKEEIVRSYFLKHWMNSELFWKQVENKVYGSAKINLNTGWLKNFLIPIPFVAKQDEIINKLNQFETLNSSLSSGLPKEIELRQKQYEYYRDKLLTFD